MVLVGKSASHYERLGVAPHASHEEIRRAYRALAQVHHPDANPEAVDAAMIEINAAWEVLGDPTRRREYDRAIGTTPRPTVWAPVEEDHEHDPHDPHDEDPLAHLRDDPDAPPAKRRPADLLLFVPPILLLTTLATFAYSIMSVSEGLRTIAILMFPVTVASFLAAPLFMMLRARRSDEAPQD